MLRRPDSAEIGEGKPEEFPHRANPTPSKRAREGASLVGTRVRVGCRVF